MSASEVSRLQQHRDSSSRTRASSYFSARERLLNRDHDFGEARKLAYQVRAGANQQQQKQTTSTKMEHQQAPGGQQQQQQQQQEEQASETGLRQLTGGAMGPRRSLRSLMAASSSDRSKMAATRTPSAHDAGEERAASRSDDELDGARSDCDEERASLERLTGEQLEQNKQHVGPVMGIFFKVWSLVKVTRMRHNKMRRQNSEDASQFHFISGDQLASTSGAQSSATLAPAAAGSGGPGKHVLQDSHFRRAGSQPPPLSHGLGQHEFGVHQAARLQVQPMGQQPQGASTTNSSSSGVSSATSSSLVASEHKQAASRRAERSAARKIEQGGEQAKARASQKPTGRSWAARIKSRASGGQQSALNLQHQQQQQQQQQLNMSRYHFRRADPNQSQVSQGQTLAGSRVAVGSKDGKPARQLRSHSELQQLDELKRRPAGPSSSLFMTRIRQQQTQRMCSDDLGDEDEDEDEDDEENTHTNEDEIGAASDEDSDLNDIYSTPNDSIQSVPSTQLLLEQRRASSTAPSQAVYPIVKSFSSQNFSQILRPQQQQQQQQQLVSANHETIDERAEHKSSSSDSNSSRTTTNNNSNQKIDSIVGGKQLLAANQSGRQNGSRFFISSSSSEDSQTHSQVNGKPSGSNATASGSHDQQVQIPIHFGLHRHEDHAIPSAVTRPNSLILTGPPASQQQPQLITPSALLLASAGPSAQESTIAAMSPMFAPAQPFSQQTRAMNGQLQQPSVQLPTLVSQSNSHFSAYKKSPSLFEMSNHQQDRVNLMTKTRFSSRYPTQACQRQTQQSDLSSFMGRAHQNGRDVDRQAAQVSRAFQVPHSISLHDCKLNEMKHDNESAGLESNARGSLRSNEHSSEYKLAQMLLKLGSNPSAAKDRDGCTALMHSVMSENLSAFKCLLEHGVDLNETNHNGMSALDLICSKPANETHLEMFSMLIDNHVDFDRARHTDGTRLLDRLIGVHVPSSPDQDKLPYIDCLLHNGAKLSSSTWLAARGKHELQLRLLRKLCQDGYFLYKKCSIEAAVYRFEYALKRIDELEQQLANDCCLSTFARGRQLDRDATSDAENARATQQVKYQTYLGLSRCERKRKFFRRALEFAHMSILVDSTSYEGYYSKAHILKDLGEIDDALIAIDQTDRLVNKSIEHIKAELSELQNQEESIVFDGCFQVHDPNRAGWIESKRAELVDNLEYLNEAKKHVSRLRCEILEDKLKSCAKNRAELDKLSTSLTDNIKPVPT